MSQGVIVPVAKALYLCDYAFSLTGPKTDLYGILNAIRPTAGYPHTQGHFCVFALLSGGLGSIPIHVDIVELATGNLIHCTNVMTLRVLNRQTTHHLAIRIPDCRFPNPGVYLVELFCDNQQVADVTLELL